MVRLQTLDLRIGVRVPASQPISPFLRSTHMPIRLLLFSALFAVLAAGQNAGDLLNKPPAGVEEALKARISEFYKLEMEGKFRQAEGMVCEDSKDAYYGGDKRRWYSMDQGNIKYTKEFKYAEAIMILGAELNTAQGILRSKIPFVTYWSAENGAWCRSFPSNADKKIITPFSGGKEFEPPTAERYPDPSMIDKAKRDMANPAALSGQIVTDKGVVEFKKGKAATETIELKNGLPGEIKIAVRLPNIPGLTVKSLKEHVGSGETSKIVLAYDPPKDAGTAAQWMTIWIEPLGQVLNLNVFVRE